MAGRAVRVEHEYQREDALTYLAAWDVRRDKLFGLCWHDIGIEGFHALVDLVMGQQPYAAARRVFWITDNGPIAGKHLSNVLAVGIPMQSRFIPLFTQAGLIRLRFFSLFSSERC
jgi:hypothetical protein